MYLIWNNRIWGSYATSDGWRPYSTCAATPAPASDTSCHRDHIHISLSWAGATAQTSYWSKKVAAPDNGPCRPVDLNWAPRYTGPNPALCPKYPVVTASAGSSATTVALVRWSGITLAAGSSGPAVTAVQRALGITADGSYGPQTLAAVTAFRAAHHLPAGSALDAVTWRALLATF